jgi:hypothetical protein
MLRTFLSRALICSSLIAGVSASTPAQSQSPPGGLAADKIKAKVTRYGTGKQARVKVQLKDKSKLKGYIGEIGQDRFTVVNPNQGTVTPVNYSEVEKIKNNNHDAVRALIFGAGTIGGLLLIVALALRGS